MSVKYEINCGKCTNAYIGYCRGEPAVWCKPAVDGKKNIYLVEDPENRKGCILKCDHYTTEPRRTDMRIL